MGDINEEQQLKVMTFQAITETHDPEIALHFLAESDWDESVSRFIKRKQLINIWKMKEPNKYLIHK